jgi:hypothetical protein
VDIFFTEQARKMAKAIMIRIPRGDIFKASDEAAAGVAMNIDSIKSVKDRVKVVKILADSRNPLIVSALANWARTRLKYGPAVSSGIGDDISSSAAPADTAKPLSAMNYEEALTAIAIALNYPLDADKIGGLAKEVSAYIAAQPPSDSLIDLVEKLLNKALTQHNAFSNNPNLADNILKFVQALTEKKIIAIEGTPNNVLVTYRPQKWQNGHWVTDKTAYENITGRWSENEELRVILTTIIIQTAETQSAAASPAEDAIAAGPAGNQPGQPSTMRKKKASSSIGLEELAEIKTQTSQGYSPWTDVRMAEELEKQFKAGKRDLIIYRVDSDRPSAIVYYPSHGRITVRQGDFDTEIYNKNETYWHVDVWTMDYDEMIEIQYISGKISIRASIPTQGPVGSRTFHVALMPVTGAGAATGEAKKESKPSIGAHDFTVVYKGTELHFNSSDNSITYRGKVYVPSGVATLNDIVGKLPEGTIPADISLDTPAYYYYSNVRGSNLTLMLDPEKIGLGIWMRNKSHKNGSYIEGYRVVYRDDGAEAVALSVREGIAEYVMPGAGDIYVDGDDRYTELLTRGGMVLLSDTIKTTRALWRPGLFVDAVYDEPGVVVPLGTSFDDFAHDSATPGADWTKMRRGGGPLWSKIYRIAPLQPTDPLFGPITAILNSQKKDKAKALIPSEADALVEYFHSSGSIPDVAVGQATVEKRVENEKRESNGAAANPPAANSPSPATAGNLPEPGTISSPAGKDIAAMAEQVRTTLPSQEEIGLLRQDGVRNLIGDISNKVRILGSERFLSPREMVSLINRLAQTSGLFARDIQYYPYYPGEHEERIKPAEVDRRELGLWLIEAAKRETGGLARVRQYLGEAEKLPHGISEVGQWREAMERMWRMANGDKAAVSYTMVIWAFTKPGYQSVARAAIETLTALDLNDPGDARTIYRSLLTHLSPESHAIATEYADVFAGSSPAAIVSADKPLSAMNFEEALTAAAIALNYPLDADKIGKLAEEVSAYIAKNERPDNRKPLRDFVKKLLDKALTQHNVFSNDPGTGGLAKNLLNFVAKLTNEKNIQIGGTREDIQVTYRPLARGNLETGSWTTDEIMREELTTIVIKESLKRAGSSPGNADSSAQKDDAAATEFTRVLREDILQPNQLAAINTLRRTGKTMKLSEPVRQNLATALRKYDRRLELVSAVTDDEAEIEQIPGSRETVKEALSALGESISSSVNKIPQVISSPFAAGSASPANFRGAKIGPANPAPRDLGGIKMSNIPVISSTASQKIEFAAIGPDFFDQLTFRIVSMKHIVSLAQFASIP